MYPFRKDIIRVPISVVLHFSKNLKELALGLRMKRLFRNGRIYHWRENEAAIALCGSKSTYRRYVIFLMKEGFAAEDANGTLWLIGIRDMIKYYGKSKIEPLNNDEILQYVLEALIVKASLIKQQYKIKTKQVIRTEPCFSYGVGGFYTSTATNHDVVFTCRKMTSALTGKANSSTGYRHLQVLMRMGLIVLTPRRALSPLYRDGQLLPYRNLPYAVEVKLPDVRRELKKEFLAPVRSGFSYCSNDCIGW